MSNLRHFINYLLFTFIFISISYGVTREQAIHRIPPVIYNLDLPKSIKSGTEYTFQWGVMGYHEYYKMSLQICGDKISKDGINYGKCISYRGIEPYDQTEGAYRYGNVNSTLFKFRQNVKLYLKGNQKLIIRFYISPPYDPIDTNYLSCIIPGGFPYKYADTSGRKLEVEGVGGDNNNTSLSCRELQFNTSLKGIYINPNESHCYKIKVNSGEKVAILSTGNMDLEAKLIDNDGKIIDESNSYKTKTQFNPYYTQNFLIRIKREGLFFINVKSNMSFGGKYNILVLRYNGTKEDFFDGLVALLNDGDTSNDYFDVYVHALFPDLENGNYGNTVSYRNVPRERQCKALVNFYVRYILGGNPLFSDCYIAKHLSNNDYDYILQDNAILLYNQNSNPPYYNPLYGNDINSVIFEQGDIFVKDINSANCYLHYGLFLKNDTIIDANYNLDGKLHITSPRWGRLKVARPDF